MPLKVSDLAEDVALAEQLLGDVEADDRDARRPALRPAS